MISMFIVLYHLFFDEYDDDDDTKMQKVGSTIWLTFVIVLAMSALVSYNLVPQIPWMHVVFNLTIIIGGMAAIAFVVVFLFYFVIERIPILENKRNYKQLNNELKEFEKEHKDKNDINYLAGKFDIFYKNGVYDDHAIGEDSVMYLCYYKYAIEKTVLLDALLKRIDELDKNTLTHISTALLRMSIHYQQEQVDKYISSIRKKWFPIIVY